jgi:thiamine-monophosphate kinase
MARKTKMGERELIELIRKKFSVHRKEIVKGIGDDAMVFRNGFVVSTDSFVDEVHFSRTYFSMYALGYHTLAASLSDLAAMGARPLCALVSLHCTAQTSSKDIEDLYRGFEKLAYRYRFDITGGDIVASATFSINLTVIGRARTPLMRSTAQPGEGLYVTNFLGLAEVGRIALREDFSKREYSVAIHKHLFPEPRFLEMEKLKRYMGSCIDTSDGLSTDATHLAMESKVKIVIDAEHVPVHAEVARCCNMRQVDPLEHILSSGEDFELLFTAQSVPKLPRFHVFKIGRVAKGSGLYISEQGREKAVEPTGYEHL